MEFRILGDLEVRAGAGRLALGGPRDRKVLAVLLLGDGRGVPVTRLVDALWDEDPPVTAAKQVRNAVSRLRQLLAGAGAPEVVAEGAGYRLVLEGAALDARLFDAQVAGARTAALAGRAADAAGMLRSALDLWRGPALAGLGGAVIGAAATAWNERRSAVQALYLDLQLALGRHHEVLGELAELAAADPWREGTAGQLMVALYRCGRQNEALDRYRGTRELLRTAGLDPGPALRALHQQILNHDPALAAPPPAPAGGGHRVPGAAVPGSVPWPPSASPGAPAPSAAAAGSSRADDHPLAPADSAERGVVGVRPVVDVFPVAIGHYAEAGPPDLDVHARAGRQDVLARASDAAAGPVAAMRTLPRDVAAFTGRDTELRGLIAAAAGAAGVVAIHAVDGMPGVGKTALVTRAAHLLAVGFPDGQLFVGLHAHTPGLVPADPAEVLAGLLACTGLGPREIPAGLEARAQRWRGRLAGKKVLLVLDDAAGHAQVEPLLPGTGGCLVLVTSRRRLIALPGAQPLALDTLPPGQAAGLFARLSRRAPDGTDIAAIADLAGLCGYLPLAIALLAGRLAHHPGWTISDFAAEFAAARDRLAMLSAGDRPGDPAVTAAFQMSYADLPAGPQRLFRLLGLHPGADIDACAAAALTDVPLAQARQDLDALYTDHLIDEPAPGRYRFHDLIRQYARALSTRHDPAADRGKATGRLLDYYQHTAQTADRHLTRTRPGPPPTAALAAAPAPDLPGQAAAVAWLRAERANLVACIGYATTTAQSRRIIALTAAMAAFLYQEGPWSQAAALHHAAATTARRHGGRLGEGNALYDLGRIRRLTGDYPAAAGLLERALAIYQDLGNRLGEANARHDLGRIRNLTGDYPAAAGLLERALAIYQDLGNCHGEANARHDLGRVRDLTGDYPAAAGLLERALAIYQDLGNRLGEANTLDDLGRVRSMTGDYPAAAGLLERAAAIYQDLGSRLGEAGVLNEVGRVRYMTGDYPAAAGLLERALAIYQDLGSRHGEAGALNDLGRVRYMTGDYPAAAGLLEQALAIYQDLGNCHGEANALHDLGRVRYLTGDHPAAAGLLERSVALFREAGDAQGEAEALNATGTLLAASAGPKEALTVYRQALQLARQVGSPLDEARALEGAARCTARTGDQKAARASLGEAVAIYQRVGAAEAGPAAADLAAMDDDTHDDPAVQESIVY